MNYKDAWVSGKEVQRDNDSKCYYQRTEELYFIVFSLQAQNEVMLI